MFEIIEALDKNKHSDLRFKTVDNLNFAANLTLIPLSYSELVQAGKYFPIVFPSQGAAIPHALLSFKQGQNDFLDQNGRWLAPYIPAHIRRYPFILSKTDQQGNFVLCIDREAPHFSKEEGEPLYAENGEPADILNNALEFLKRYQQEMQDTEKLFGILKEKGLLADKQFNIEQEGQKSTVRGFKAVDTEKLTELDNETLGDLVRRGIIGLVYAHLHSMDNARVLAGR